jgi:hypothetical protein
MWVTMIRIFFIKLVNVITSRVGVKVFQGLVRVMSGSRGWFSVVGSWLDRRHPFCFIDVCCLVGCRISIDTGSAVHLLMEKKRGCRI